MMSRRGQAVNRRQMINRKGTLISRRRMINRRRQIINRKRTLISQKNDDKSKKKGDKSKKKDDKSKKTDDKRNVNKSRRRVINRRRKIASQRRRAVDPKNLKKINQINTFRNQKSAKISGKKDKCARKAIRAGQYAATARYTATYCVCINGFHCAEEGKTRWPEIYCKKRKGGTSERSWLRYKSEKVVDTYIAYVNAVDYERYPLDYLYLTLPFVMKSIDNAWYNQHRSETCDLKVNPIIDVLNMVLSLELYSQNMSKKIFIDGYYSKLMDTNLPNDRDHKRSQSKLSESESIAYVDRMRKRF